MSDRHTSCASGDDGPSEVFGEAEEDCCDGRERSADDDDDSPPVNIGQKAPQITRQKSTEEVGRRHEAGVPG